METRPKVVKLKPKMTKSNEKHRDMMRSPLAQKSPVSTEKVLYFNQLWIFQFPPVVDLAENIPPRRSQNFHSAKLSASSLDDRVRHV